MKSMREVNLDTYSLSLLTAKEDILNPRSSTNWALFAYDGIMNRLKLADSGGGLEELSTKLHPKRPLYGMVRVDTAQPCIIMILWVGNEVDEYRKAECAGHHAAIRNFFKEVHIFLPAHTLDEITEERICTLACNAAAVTKGPRGRPGRRMEDRQAIVGTNYKRTIAAAEIQRIQRDSFWAQAEREEEERKKEEQRRAAEDRRQRERERMLQEKREAMERDRRLNEKEQKIKEQRRIQAEMDAEAHKQEKLKWEYQEREREEDEMRARYFRSESEEKSSEAAALVSQRVANTREFFRQLSSSSVHTPSSPSSPYPVRDLYRQLHRSQTDSIFSFSESPSSPPAYIYPYRSSLVSPYFQSIPTSQKPTPFTNSAASSLQNCAMVSIKSQIHLSSSKIMEPYAVTAAGPAPVLQTQAPLTDANDSETETPIGDILDSLVFYPPPATAEQLKTRESEMVDEFPPPLSGFENSPELVVNQPETLVDPLDTPMSSLPQSSLLVPEPPARPLPALPVAPRMLKDLKPGRDFTARASVIPTVEEEDVGEKNEEREIKDEGKDVPGKDGDRRGQEKGKGGQKEEHDGMIMGKHESVKESNSGKKQDGKMLEERESGKDQDGKMLEERVSGKGQDGKMLEERVSGKEQDGNMLEERESRKEEEDEYMLGEHGSGKEDDGRIEERESGKEEDGEMLEERESGKEEDGEMLEERESGKEEDGKMLEERESGKEEDGKMLEERESGKEEDGKMLEERESGKEEDGKMLEERESGKEHDGEIMEEEESEKIQHAKMMLGCVLEKEQDGKIVNVFDNKNEQEGKNMEDFEAEKYEKMMEECGQENKQYGQKFDVRKYEKEHDGEREHGGEVIEELKVGSIVEEHEIDKEQDWKMIDELDRKKIQNSKILLEHMRGKEQDGINVEAFDSKIEQDRKSMEVFETAQTQYVKRMEECGQENEQDRNILEKREDEHVSENEQGGEIDGKIVEKHGSEEKQDRKIVDGFNSEKEQCGTGMEVFETENIQYVKMMEKYDQEDVQDGKIVEKFEKEHDNEKELDGKIVVKHEDGKSPEEHESETNQDWKMIEDKVQNKIQDGDIIEEHVFETEKIQYVKMMEDCGQENEQNGRTVEKCEEEYESEKVQDGMMEKRQIQDNKRMSCVDVDTTVNVLREEESFTEIIKRDEAKEEAVEQVKSNHGNEKEGMNAPLIHTEESSADTLFFQHSPLFPESRATEPPQYNDTSIPESILSAQDKNEPQISSSHQINLPIIQAESDLSNLSIQRDSDDMKEKTHESVDSQASSKNGPDASSAERGPDTEIHVTVKDEQTETEAKIVDGAIGLAEGINTGSEKSPISENQARIGQSDEREGLVPVSHFLQDPDTAIGLKHCITHQLDLSNDISDVEEREEAVSLIVRDTDVEQILKCDSVHDIHKHKILQDCKTMMETPSNTRNDKTADDK